MQTDVRQLLSQSLVKVSTYYARLVADSSTKIEIYPAPFLKHHQIYRVEHFNPHKPVLFYVGFASGKRAYLLTGAPENYILLAQADSVVIDSTEKASNYAIVYLEVTRSMASLFYLVRSVDEVGFRPNLTDEEEKIKTAFLKKYRSLIAPPTANSADRVYVVTAYAVREQALERHYLTVGRDGRIKDDTNILEQNLPLVYGL